MTTRFQIPFFQAEAIKSSLKQVQEKVDRSVALLKSLGAERERWEAGSETFTAQMSTIIGDCLLTSSFMAYGGYFDQQMRHNLFSSWCQHLSQAKIRLGFQTQCARFDSNDGSGIIDCYNSIPLSFMNSFKKSHSRIRNAKSLLIHAVRIHIYILCVK